MALLLALLGVALILAGLVLAVRASRARAYTIRIAPADPELTSVKACLERLLAGLIARKLKPAQERTLKLLAARPRVTAEVYAQAHWAKAWRRRRYRPNLRTSARKLLEAATRAGLAFATFEPPMKEARMATTAKRTPDLPTREPVFEISSRGRSALKTRAGIVTGSFVGLGGKLVHVAEGGAEAAIPVAMLQRTVRPWRSA